MAQTTRITTAVFASAIAVAGSAWSSSSAAAAGDPVVNFAGSNSHFTGDCRGADASLAGSGNIVTIRGGCRAFQIAGGDNRVLVDMAAGGTIKVYGSNNAVSWTSPGEVEITTVGQDNTVTRAR
jgi:hypothetical protein